MNATQLQKAAAVASVYNDSDVWAAESFRFKNCDDFGKSELFTLKNSDIIVERDDGWSTTTWEWTDGGSLAVEMVDTSPITNASEKQLNALSEHAETLLGLPRNDTFLASEYDLIGQNLQTLSSTDLLVQVDTVGQLGVWRLSDFSLRVLTSLEAEEMRVSQTNHKPKTALESTAND